MAGVLTAGCATTRANGPARTAELERTTIELRAQNAGYLRQIDELQNRIFILEDHITSLTVADAGGAPALPPSRRIGAPARAGGTSSRARVMEEPPGEEEDEMVEYAGEAVQPANRGRTRTLLRLAGNGSPRIITVAITPSTDPVAPAPAPAETIAADDPAPPATSEPVRLYRQALDALHAGHHATALGGFRKFLARFPRHDYDDNAQYWIGECYYDLGQYKSAVREFRRVVERYPRGNKVPDAMLKMGFARLALGDRRDGRQELESVRRLYPKHAAARLAMARLNQPDDQTSRPSRPLRAPPTVTLEMTGR